MTLQVASDLISLKILFHRIYCHSLIVNTQRIREYCHILITTLVKLRFTTHEMHSIVVLWVFLDGSLCHSTSLPLPIFGRPTSPAFLKVSDEAGSGINQRAWTCSHTDMPSRSPTKSGKLYMRHDGRLYHGTNGSRGN